MNLLHLACKSQFSYWVPKDSWSPSSSTQLPLHMLLLKTKTCWNNHSLCFQEDVFKVLLDTSHFFRELEFVLQNSRANKNRRFIFSCSILGSMNEHFLESLIIRFFWAWGIVCTFVSKVQNANMLPLYNKYKIWTLFHVHDLKI